MKHQKQKTICVDFDGVIHSYTHGWQNGEVYGDLIEGSKECMKFFIDKGYRVVILTARIQPKYSDSEEQKGKMTEWLTKNGFLLDQHYHEVTNNKPSAIMYIDDKAVRFTNWREMKELV